MFFELFDAIYIINLRSRPDRRSEMLEQLERIGLANDSRLRFFDAVEVPDAGVFPQRGAHGCYLSHLSILEREAAMNRPVLILEDDCDFRRGAMDYRLPAEWDIFYGGYWADDPRDPVNSNIIGAHCMGYSATAVTCAAEYLSNLLDPDFPPDPRASSEPGFEPAVRPPFDGALVWLRRAHPELRTVFAQVAVQRASRSDIATNRKIDRMAPRLAAAARRLKNKFRQRIG